MGWLLCCLVISYLYACFYFVFGLNFLCSVIQVCPKLARFNLCSLTGIPHINLTVTFMQVTFLTVLFRSLLFDSSFRIFLQLQGAELLAPSMMRHDHLLRDTRFAAGCYLMKVIKSQIPGLL